jgi:hypothetical protein
MTDVSLLSLIETKTSRIYFSDFLELLWLYIMISLCWVSHVELNPVELHNKNSMLLVFFLKHAGELRIIV